MRTRRREKQDTRRRQEQEYRDKISNQTRTLSKFNAPTRTFSEGRLETKPTEATQLVLVQQTKPIEDIPRIVLPAPIPRSNWTLIVLAYLLGIVGLGINAWFAWGRGATLPDKVLMSSLGFIAEAIMFFLLCQAATLWARRQWIRSFVAFLVWLALFVSALTNSLGFASLNLSEVSQTRAERISPEVSDAQRRRDTLSESRASECLKRGDKCRQLEKEEQQAMDALKEAREKVSAIADPLTISAAKLVARVSLGHFHPTADDLATFQLLLLMLLPQLGGLVLMVGKGRTE